MRKMNHVGLVFGVVALLATGCGIGKPKPILDGPPVPAQVGAAIPFTPVQNPLDDAAFAGFPCGILKSEQVAALVVDPPEKVVRGGGRQGMIGCSWNIWNGPTVGIYSAIVKPNSLTEVAEQREMNPGQYPQWREFSIDGIPVVEYLPRYSSGVCEILLGISDTRMSLVEYALYGQNRSQYWGDDVCAGARKAAEFMIGNLRGA